MSSITLYPDVPCSYPTTVGLNETLVGDSSTLIAAFRNNSSIANLRAVLQTMHLLPHEPSADTLMTIQFIAQPTIIGGTWNSITGSELEINTTASSFISGKVALTVYSDVTRSHGNSPATASIANEDMSNLGLELYVGQAFAVVAQCETTSSTTHLAWSFNWLEKD
jgi:hypothetical protein